MKPGEPCPCGSGQRYAACCGPLHAGEQPAASAEALMRSRYSAYVLKLADYLLATWHPSTRPSELDLAADDSKWLGLAVKSHVMQDENHASVEFVARYRIGGGSVVRMREHSRFVREGGHWFYLEAMTG